MDKINVIMTNIQNIQYYNQGMDIRVFQQSTHIQQILYNSMASNLKNLLSMALLLALTTGVFVELNHQPFCLTLPQIYGAEYKIFYESASDKSSLRASIEGKHIQKSYISGSTNETTVDSNFDIQFCLYSQGKQSVSIDFYPSQQKQYKQLALKSHVQQIHQQLVNVGLTLRQIAHIQQFQEQRRAKQCQKIQNHQKTIFTYGVIKIILVIIMIVGQLLLLRKKIGLKKIKKLFSL